MSTAQLKELVKRFNKECLEEGNETSLHELVADDMINHTAMPGMDPGKQGILDFIRLLGAAMPERRVEIYEMIAENDTVVTRKAIIGKLQAPLMGVPGDGREISLPTIDIIKFRNGQYVAHWAERHVQQ